MKTYDLLTGKKLHDYSYINRSRLDQLFLKSIGFGGAKSYFDVSLLVTPELGFLNHEDMAMNNGLEYLLNVINGNKQTDIRNLGSTSITEIKKIGNEGVFSTEYLYRLVQMDVKMFDDLNKSKKSEEQTYRVEKLEKYFDVQRTKHITQNIKAKFKEKFKDESHADIISRVFTFFPNYARALYKDIIKSDQAILQMRRKLVELVTSDNKYSFSDVPSPFNSYKSQVKFPYVMVLAPESMKNFLLSAGTGLNNLKEIFKYNEKKSEEIIIHGMFFNQEDINVKFPYFQIESSYNQRLGCWINLQNITKKDVNRVKNEKAVSYDPRDGFSNDNKVISFNEAVQKVKKYIKVEK